VAENSSDTNNLYAARNLIFSVIGIFGCIGLIALFFLSLAMSAYSGVDASTLSPTYDLIWFMGFFLLLTIPFLVISIYQLMKKEPPKWLKLPELQKKHYFIILGIWVVILLFSYLLGMGGSYLWLVAPPLKILAIMIPLTLILLYLTNRFGLNNPSRNWGMISFSVIFTEPLTIFIEIILVFVFLIAVGVSGDWSKALGNDAFVYLNRLVYGANNPDILSRIAMPFLSQPVILFIVFSLFSIIIPMLEEIMKPLGLWFFSKKTLAAKDGFFYGAMGGMVFALIESVMGLTSFGMESWVAISIVRLGTGILHMFTAGMMGWALTSSWKEEKFGKLIGIYLLCIVVHGAWNFMAIGMSLSQLAAGVHFAAGNVLTIVFPILMFLMAIGMLYAMVRITRRLTAEIQPSIYG
jgi:hypothetical protein